MEFKWDTSFLKTRNKRKTSGAIRHNNQETGAQPQNQNRFFEKVDQQSKNKEKVRAARIESTRSKTMLGARFCTSQKLGSLCRARLVSWLANNLTLTLVLVILLASFAISASYNAPEMEHTNLGQQQGEEPAKTIVSLGDIGDHMEASRHLKPRETTLLEDEQREEHPQPSPAAAITSAQSTPSAGDYGKVVHTSEEQLPAAKQHQEPPTSMFSRLKANLSYYLPFLSQINIFRQSNSEHEQTSPSHAAKESRQQVSESLRNNSDGFKKNDIDKKQDHSDSRLQPTKQSVSAIKAIKVEQAEPEMVKHLSVNLNVSGPADDEIDLREDQENEHERKLSGNVRISSTSKRVSMALADNERDLNEMVAAQQEQDGQQQQSARTVSAMRQSNLMLPLRDELLVRGAPDNGASGDRDSLLGRYIYAPTQHYYLNALPARPHDTSNQLKSAYAFQKQPDGVLGFAHLIDPSGASVNKSAQSSDLYFLIMVGAFCVMAMAVVLAAGLFAYRVQQQRKTSQDMDYPTYGVVGPNNMAGVGSGKSAGAAAFVNGYFGSSLASGKSASAKHLPDLYGQAAAIDSGLEKSLSASMSSTHKKNSSSTISSARTNNNNEPPSRGTNGNNLFASTATNQDAARMYLYQHQKQQMIVSDRSSAGRHTSASDLDSDEGDDDGSYTVYECPGLASAHEMEIKNPLFNDDHSP